MNIGHNCLTVEGSLQLAVELLKFGDRDWRLGRDIHALLQIDLEGERLQLPMDEDEFVLLLEKDERFKSLAHGFFALGDAEVDMDHLNRLIAMNDDYVLFAESCRTKAGQDLGWMEKHAKKQGITLEKVTPFGLEQRTLLIMQARKAYPRGAKVTFDDEDGHTNNGLPTKATGTVSDVMIMPNGRREIGICCRRYRGVEILTVCKREEDIIEVVRGE